MSAVLLLAIRNPADYAINYATIYNNLKFCARPFQGPQAHKLVDEDPIVDEDEINTNSNNLDNVPVTISKTYQKTELKKWRPAPVVPANPGQPGEMGNYYFNLITF